MLTQNNRHPSTFPPLSAAEKAPFDGSGTEADPFQIKTVADLQKLDELVDGAKTTDDLYVNAYYKQMADITIVEADNWTGIGLRQVAHQDVVGSFRGTYDGDGKNLSIYFNGAAMEYNGAFFQSIRGGTVKNLDVTITGHTSRSGEFGLGGLAGYSCMSLYTNVVTHGTIDSTHTSGGIVLFAQGSGVNTFVDCVNNIEVIGKKAGGFVGQTQSGSLAFIRCVNNGAVTGIANNKKPGGFASEGCSATLEDCVNNGLVTATSPIVPYQFTPATITAITGVNTVRADQLVLPTSLDGANFATVAGEPAVATLISTNGFVKGNTYKVMANGVAGEVFTLAAENDTISFDLSLVNDACNFTVGAAAGLKAEKGDVTEHVVIFTAVKDLANYTVTLSYSDTEIKSATINETAWAGDAQEFVEGTAITVAAVAQDGYENVTYKIGDETITGGAFTLASNTVVTVSATQAGGEDWPTNPEDPLVKDKTAAEAFPGKVPTALANVPAANFAAWAIKAGIDFANPGEINVDAYLLDCAVADLETEKAKFVITSIAFDGEKWVVTVANEFGDEQPYNDNAAVEIVPVEIDGAAEDAAFFKATLKPITLTK